MAHFITLACQLLALATFCTGSPIEAKNLVVLGHVSGKTFFYDKQFTNQTQASALCAAGGTTLASISSIDELDFLQQKYSPDGFNGQFWTDGVDARNPQQFIWKTGEINMPEGLRWTSFYPTQTCVFYHASPYSSNNGYLTSFICSGIANGALCQSLD